jgi:hypothetical protein
MSWHLDPASVRRYRDGELAAGQFASIDTHLATCADCRAVVAADADIVALARVKVGIDARLDTPRVSLVERVLRAVGVAPVAARIMSVSLSLTASWLAASTVVLAFAALAASNGSGRAGFGAFLVAAPLVPMAGVALAFGPGLDPAHQITVAAPMPTARIILLRSLAVVAAAVPMILLVSIALPGWSTLAVAWLLPAFALGGASLALGTVVPVGRAAVALASVWLVGAAIGLSDAPRTSVEAFVHGFVAFRPAGQLLSLLVAAASVAVVSARRTAFETVR